MFARMEGFLCEKLFHFSQKLRIIDPVPERAHGIAEEGFACRKKRGERVEIGRDGRVAIVPIFLLPGLEVAVARGEGNFAAAQARRFAAGGGHGPSFRFFSCTVFRCAAVIKRIVPDLNSLAAGKEVCQRFSHGEWPRSGEKKGGSGRFR